MAATATVNHFRIMDNSALDSSMDSTQGLLGFMASASRQIKTYLGPEQQQKSNQVCKITCHHYLCLIFLDMNYAPSGQWRAKVIIR